MSFYKIEITIMKSSLFNLCQKLQGIDIGEPYHEKKMCLSTRTLETRLKSWQVRIGVSSSEITLSHVLTVPV